MTRLVGKVGDLDYNIEQDYYLYKLVLDGVITFSELEKMTLYELDCMMALHDMQTDYKNAMRQYHNEQHEKRGKK